MKNPPCRRTLLTAIGAIATTAFGFAPAARAQTAASAAAPAYPWKPVQIIVPSPAGSPPDVRARELAELVAPLLGQAVIVVNKPGAAGAVGMQAAAASVPDGHTIVFCTAAPLTVAPALYERLPYDPVASFAPLMVAFRGTLVLVAGPSLQALGVASLTDLVRLAKERPGSLFYASAGNGTPPHVLFDLFRHGAAIEMVHVPYVGGPAVMNALLAGDAGAAIDSVSQALPHIASGRLKALAVTGAERLATLPDVPTFAEAGIAGMDDSWSAILAPAGTPRDTLARLHRDFARALEAPALLARYAAIGIRAVASSPEELARRIAEDSVKWQRIVKRAGITPG